MNGRERVPVGPFGALPALSATTRRALIGIALLAAVDAFAIVAAAWTLAQSLSRHDELAFFALAIGARALLAWATRAVAARAAAGTKADLRARLLDTALRRDPEWIRPAELTSVATHGLDALDDYFTRFLPAIVGASVTVPLVGLAILLTDWRSAVLIAITVPLIPLFAALIGRFTQARHAADATVDLAGQLLELLRALPVLVAFGRAGAQAKAVRAASERHRVATRATLRIAFLSAFALDVLATLSVALVAVDIGLRLLNGNLTLATALVVLILAPECYLPLRAAGAAYHASEDGLEAVRRVATLVGAEGDPVPEGVRPAHLRHQLDLRRGHITRLDGPSGSGKSTVIAAILGFTDRAAVNVDVPLDEIAWIPQHPHLTGPLVTDELRQAAPTCTEAELRAALSAAVAGHLAARPVHELSAGERQRVAVARALVRLRAGAWLLLADEPTAHVDPPTAARLMSAIDQAAEAGAAVLLVTHAVTETAEALGSTTSIPVAAPPVHAETSAPLRLLLDRRLVAGAVLGALALASAVALTATAAWLIATAAGHPSIVVLSVAVVAVRAFGLAKGTFRYAERLVTHDAAFRLATRLRVRLWHALVQAGPARTASLRRTDGLRRLVDDTDTIRDLVPRVLTPPVAAIVVAMGAVALASVLSLIAGLGLAIALVVGGVVGPLLGLAAERRATKRIANDRRRLNGAVFDLLDGAADLIAVGAHRRRRADVAALDRNLAATARRQAWAAGLTNGIAVAALGFAALVGCFVATGTTAVVLALLPLALAETLDTVAPALRQLPVLRAAYARVTLPVPPTQPIPRGPISLRGVTVHWPDTATPALRDVTLEVPVGTEIAITGPSGAGKSTLLALLLGFLTPDTGTARIPATVAWCPADPHLVATTIRENLRLGDPTATDETLRAALRTVALDSWQNRLDTRLGPFGSGMSGGEARRLALARALLRAPCSDVVLLDEPTAHLDDETAERVLTDLRAGLAGKTVLMVTHRPDEARAAAMTVHVDNGQVTVSQPVA